MDKDEKPIKADSKEVSVRHTVTDKGLLLKGIKRVSEYYQCSVQKIQDLINDGTIPSYKLGKNRYFYTNEIDEALRDRSKIPTEK